jgi:purine-binding chemotaxis protein CheW
MENLDAIKKVSSLAAGRRQFLTFSLGSESYAIDILRVQEIKGYTAITTLPNAPPEIRGVMNLRGTVVPVLDLRVRFGMDRGSYDKFSVIIVVMVGSKIVGLLVDAVSDVLDISEEQIEVPPNMGSKVDTSFMIGMAKAADLLLLVLDIEKLITAELLTGSEQIATQGSGAQALG